MILSKALKSIALLLMVCVASSAAATSKSGKVRFVVGEVTIDKKSGGKWEALRLNAKVQEKDLVRTLVESQAIIALPDGSSISVEENSMVEFTQMVNEDGVQTAMTDIKSGKVRFDVQKQQGPNSSFQFKTGTAVAAIRGTSGTIGLTSKGKPIASLRNGRLELNLNGKVVGINGGQTAVPNEAGDDFLVLDLASSGDLNALKEIDALLSDTTKALDETKNAIMAMDSVYSAQQKTYQDSTKCNFEALPDTIHEPSVVIKGTCPASIDVEVVNERMPSTGDLLQFSQNWAPSSVGEKKFPVTCYVGKISFSCGYVSTYYEPVKEEVPVADTTSATSKFSVTTKSPVKVCESGSVKIDGTFDPADTTATLYVKLGTYTSPNLVPLSANGNFTHTISISDQKGNWNEKQATVEFNGKNGSEKIVLDLDIDKTCASVNLKRPNISFLRSDSIRCDASIAITEISDDIVILSTNIDGSPVKETYFEKDSRSTFSLTTGIHEYTFTATDLAGNKAHLKKVLGCYPPNIAALSIGSFTERLRVPPPPKGVNKKFHKMMRFNLTNVPMRDVAQVKKVTVRQGDNILLLLQGSQITDLSFEIPVELVYGAKSKIDVEVIMKNGQILKASKNYEVH